MGASGTIARHRPCRTMAREQAYTLHRNRRSRGLLVAPSTIGAERFMDVFTG